MSMFHMLNRPLHPQFSFDRLWKLQTPPRVNLFLWRLAHDRLMTNSERTRRGMTDSDECPRCHQAPESIMHLLRDCEASLELWEKIVKPSVWHSFASLGQQAWLELNLTSVDIGVENWHWPIEFGCLVHMLWIERNHLVFSGHATPPELILPKLFGQVEAIQNSLLSPVPTFIEERRCEV